MLQAAMGDGHAFDPLTLGEDGLGPAEVDVCRGEIVEALVIALMIVVLDESRDGSLQIARQVIVVEQNAVL